MLTDVALKRLKPREKPYKVADRDGLYVLVTPKGSKLWRYNYRVGGKQRTAALGAYPEVSLQKARERLAETKRSLVGGSNQSKTRDNGLTFRMILQAYIEKREEEESAPRTIQKLRLHGGYLDETLGEMPVAEIEPSHILIVLRRFEAANAFETASRLRALASRVFRFAVAAGLATTDPAAMLAGALVVRPSQRRAAIFAPKAVGRLWAAICGYDRLVMRCGLQLTMLTLLRPGEVRNGRWHEIEGDVWRVPAGRMKMRREHVVPLSPRALEVLAELREHTGSGEFLLPGFRSAARPISDNAMNAALRGLGYAGDEVVAHGFRRIGSTLLNEAGWNRDWIEAQLAHVQGGVRGVYNAAQYLDGRRRMMEAWAEMLDRMSRSTSD